MNNYIESMGEILKMFGLDGRSVSKPDGRSVGLTKGGRSVSKPDDDQWMVNLFDTRREGTVETVVRSPEQLDELTQTMDEFRAMCTEFIDNFTEYCTFPPTEWDKYMAINMRIWAEAVTNHIAVMMRWLPDAEKVRIAKDFSTILLSKNDFIK